MKKFIVFKCWVAIIFLIMSCSYFRSQNTFKHAETSNSKIDDTTSTFPDKSWTFLKPQAFGYSAEKFDDIENYFNTIGGEALVVIKNGYLMYHLGDIEEPIDGRSLRKTFISPLLGIAIDSLDISIESTLETLRIDDNPSLNNLEKQTTLKDLLRSASNINREGAYESKEQKEKGFSNGFSYRNWGFNALGGIYENIMDDEFFKNFRDRIAIPVDMQDFSLDNTKYFYEKSKSKFPAFLFKTSARDDARFGLLFLNNRRWKDMQVVPNDWVRLSLSKQITTGNQYYYDYGYLWWVDDKNKRFFARGNSGQYIAVIPKENMVVVFRADPGSIFKKLFGLRVKPQESFQLVDKILSCKY